MRSPCTGDCRLDGDRCAGCGRRLEEIIAAGVVSGATLRPPWWLRFLRLTVRLPPDPDQQVGCLWWCGAQSRGGQRRANSIYGSFRVNARVGTVRAHVAAAHAGGLITGFHVPPGMNLAHSCDRSLCVEEAHLGLQPALDNIRDRHARSARPLTDAQLDAIRCRGVRGEE